MVNEIANLNIYNEGMRKSIEDKLFFLPLVDDDKVKAIVDYGCADGTLLSLIPSKWEKIGIDMNIDMLTRAEELCQGGKFILANNLPLMDGEGKILNLSSVLHEIYSYGTKDDVLVFWKNLFNSNYDYIVIRDLITDVPNDKEAELFDILKIRNHPIYSKLVASFESKWGSISYQKNLLHFLLKYRYVENWDREVNENYFNLSVNELLNIIPRQYEVFYKKTYCLPFVQKRIKKDFGIWVEDTTHIQLILKKVN